jgi:hypothetical protein
VACEKHEIWEGITIPKSNRKITESEDKSMPLTLGFWLGSLLLNFFLCYTVAVLFSSRIQCIQCWQCFLIVHSGLLLLFSLTLIYIYTWPLRFLTWYMYFNKKWRDWSSNFLPPPLLVEWCSHVCVFHMCRSFKSSHITGSEIGKI